MTDHKGMVDEAWEQLGLDQPERAAALARLVLTHHPDEIDAYVVLAATREIRTEAVALLKEAARIGAKVAVADHSQHGEHGATYDLDAHVRALNNLARLLWADPRPGSREDALKHARRALRLDPYDRAGTRLLLMAWEAAAGNWLAARRITRRYRAEDRTEVRYWLALHAFRDRALDADTLLDKALATNPHVLAALDRRIVPMHLPTGSYLLGSPEEAAIYAIDARDGWENTPGAMKWLSSHMV